MLLQGKKVAVKFSAVLLVLLSAAACHNFYKANTLTGGSNVQKAGTIDSLKKNNRYYILRSGDVAYHMRNLQISNDQLTLQCTLDSLPSYRRLHLSNGVKGKRRYYRGKPESSAVLNEVHFYIPDEGDIPTGNYLLALDKVQKIEVLEKDVKRTTNSYVIGAIGYTLGAAAVAGIIIAATKSSCPFVSAHDGERFTLQGELYGGALYPQLARHDYIPLKMAPLKDGSLQLKISNELQEHQYTDIAELLVISHPKSTKVFADEKGSLYTIAQPQAPAAARLNDKEDILAALLEENDNRIAYFSDTSQSNAQNNIVVRFKKPKQAAKAKLVLTLKNSYWLDLLYGELAKGFGSYYDTYIKQQEKKPAAELIQWTKDQQIPLDIAIRKSGKWEMLASLSTIGPLANRTLIVPAVLTDDENDMVEFRLSAGFMFWEIDKVAVDFTPEADMDIQRLLPAAATDEKGQNVTHLLHKEDGLYLSQPAIGNVATIVYRPQIQMDPDAAYTCILHSKGYYQHIRDFKHKPNLTFLQQFTRPGAFPVYGMQLYHQFQKQTIASLQHK
ncbi:MAG TPA: hypothetical protein PKC69_00110 [Chitinophagaceae bacterium]|nr:hypothetical protein [Chitinophagaceae bacterium]